MTANDGPAGGILFVDDDEGFRTIVSRHLRSRGLTVEEAETAEAALELVRAGFHPAVMLLDLNLPGQTGWDVLRARELDDAGLRVLITSATTVSPKRLTEFHVDGYLPKPFPLETLVAAIERLTVPATAVIEQDGPRP
jgi:DNA-binding response OmpR family regulator